SIPPLISSLTASSPTEIYTLSLHDALPISDHPDDLLALFVLQRVEQALRRCGEIGGVHRRVFFRRQRRAGFRQRRLERRHAVARSEEHTSELQSLAYLVCRLLLEKKKKHSS